jgi:hypothetical protein
MKAERGTLWWARIVCLSAFGPYIMGSARTEQIAVFASLALILVTGWPRMINAPFGPAPFLVAWCGLYGVMLIATPWRAFDPMYYGSQPVSHALASFALPVALMVITWYWTLRADPVSLIYAVAPLMVGGMCVNTVIEIAQVSAGKAAIVSFLPRFWDATPSAGSVAANAATDGRFTGIFDQPAEAGIAYGAALLCLIWFARRHTIRAPTVMLAGVMLVAGGTLTVSKAFLLGALPVAVITVLRGPARIRVAMLAASVSAALWLAGSANLLPVWQGGPTMLAHLAHPGGSLVVTFTAGRYGTDGGLRPAATDVLRASPWAGFGAGGLNAPYDSLWLQVFAVSGILGLILTASVLVMLAVRWLRLRECLARTEWHLAGGVLALAVGTSLGIPSLTANRACTLLWLIAGTLLVARPARLREASEVSTLSGLGA